MDCKTVRQALFLYADDELDAELLARFCAHLGLCPECQDQANHARRLVLIVRQRCQCLRLSAPERLRVRILASLHQPQEERAH
jgi:mycothiol system anti-sigma-R factor